MEKLFAVFVSIHSRCSGFGFWKLVMESDDVGQFKDDYKRRLWLLGFADFISFQAVVLIA